MSPFFLLLGNRYQRAIDERSVRTEPKFTYVS